jgi:hypothetical protein
MMEREILRSVPPTEIVPGLWIGDQRDAAVWPHELICVLEGYRDPRVRKGSYWIPILKQNHSWSTWEADHGNLRKIARLITRFLKENRQVMVHCAMGIERSPLTVAYFLVVTGRANGFPEAYALIKKKRPIVWDRSEWL